MASTDVADFEHAVQNADRESADEAALEHWTSADALWSGPPNALGGSALLEPTEARLRRSRAQAVLHHAECLYRLGQNEHVLRVAGAAQSADPCDERLAAVCARALAATGHKAAALELLSTTRASLRDQLGISPSDLFIEVEDRIVRESANLETVDTTPAAAPRGIAFVGRAAEIATLLDARPGLHVVVGEPGSGKTALVAHVATQLTATGHTVLWAKATQTPSRPMEPLAELLTKIAEATEHTDQSDALRSALSRLAPDLVVGDVSQPASRDGLLTLTREAIEQFIEVTGQVVLVVDDAQWLDRSSAQVIDTLVDDANLPIVVTSRESIPNHLPFLADESRRVSISRLDPLTRTEVESLVKHELASLPLETTTDLLLAQSGGNALFVTLLADLLSEGALDRSALPPNVLVTVKNRLASLSADAQRTLEIASVFSDSFLVEILSELAPDAERHVAEATSQGLLVSADAPGRYRFAHALVAEAAYQLLADGSKLELHDEIGRLLEAWGAAAAEYALHCGEAAPLDPNRAVRSHLFAAREFAASFDWDTAVLHAQRGIGYHDEFQLEPAALHAELLVIAGAAWRAQGRPEGDELLLAGVELAIDHEEIATSVMGLLALCTHGRMASAEGPVIYGYLERALSFGLTVAQRGQLLACKATLVSISPLQQEGRHAHDRAFDMLNRFEDEAARREILLRTHLGFPHPADFHKRIASTEMLSEMAGNDPDLLYEVAFLSLGTAMVSGDTATATASLASLQDLRPRIRMRRRDYGVRFSEAAWARYTGDLDQAEALLDTAMQIGAESFDDSWTLFVYAAIMSSIREAQGRLHELLPLIDQWIEGDPDWPTWHATAAACAASMNDAERATSEMDWLKRDGFACLSPDVSWPAMFSLLTGPVMLLEDAEAANMLLPLIEPYAGINLWNGACVHKSADEVIDIYRQVANKSQA